MVFVIDAIPFCLVIYLPGVSLSFPNSGLALSSLRKIVSAVKRPIGWTSHLTCAFLTNMLGTRWKIDDHSEVLITISVKVYGVRGHLLLRIILTIKYHHELQPFADSSYSLAASQPQPPPGDEAEPAPTGK